MKIQQSTTAYALCFLMVESADHVTPLTGASPTVKLSKNGASGGAAAGAISEIDSTNVPGWYKVAGNATDSNTLGALILHATAASGDPSDTLFEVVAQDLTQAATTVSGDLSATMKTSVATACGVAIAAAEPLVSTLSGDFTSTMKTSIGTAVAASAVASVTAAVTVTGTPDVNVKTINGHTVSGNGSTVPWTG